MDAYEVHEGRTDTASALTAHLQSRGIALTGFETPADLVDLRSALERFDATLVAHRRDLTLDDLQGSQPGDQPYLRPGRKHGETARAYIEPIEGATSHLASMALERARHEVAREESEQLLRRMADKVPEVVWITGLAPERVLYCSPSFERVWGRPVEALYRDARLWTEAIHPEDRARVADTFTRWIAGEDVSYHDVEYRIIQPGGAARWMHERGVLLRDEQGRPYPVSGISTDITDRKLAEQELRRSEAYLAEAQRLSLTGSLGWTVSTGELYWSAQSFSIVGYDQDVKPTLELVLKRVHPEDSARVERALERAARDGSEMDFEHRLLMPDGSVKHVHVWAHADRDQPGGGLQFVGALMDVTALKQGHQALDRPFV